MALAILAKGMDENTLKLGLFLRQSAITNPYLIDAFQKVPATIFHAELDALRPELRAYMIDKLDIDKYDKILEIGTSSGYQTALMAQIARRVYTLDIQRPIHRAAQQKFQHLSYSNITAMCGDGLRGWEAQKPFDRIIVNAACQLIPENIVNHLKPNGVMVLPLIEPHQQQLKRIYKNADGYEIEDLRMSDFQGLIQGESI